MKGVSELQKEHSSRVVYAIDFHMNHFRTFLLRSISFSMLPLLYHLSEHVSWCSLSSTNLPLRSLLSHINLVTQTEGHTLTLGTNADVTDNWSSWLVERYLRH